MKMYPTNGILFRALLVASFLLSFSWADPHVRLSSTSAEDVRKQLRELKSMDDADLDEDSKEELYRLWAEASEIAELNDRCSEISLTEELDDRCSNFYKVKLPDFEKDYSQLTGEVRMNSLRLRLAMNDKRDAIEACYDAFPLAEFNISKMYGVQGDVVPEPLEGGKTEVTYSFNFRMDRERWESFKDMLARWYGACESQIMRSDGSGELAPLFASKMKSFKGTGLYGVSSGSQSSQSTYGNYSTSPTRIWLVLKKSVSVKYTLNGKTLFNKSFVWGSPVVGFDFASGSVFYNSEFESSVRGTAVLSRAESEKGIYGRIEWDNPYYSGGDGESVSKKTEQGESLVRFFIRPGFLIGMEGARDGLRGQYPGAWNGLNDQVADTAFYQGMVFATAAMRIQGNVAFLGFGGGLNFRWMSTERVAFNSQNDLESESVNLQMLFAPSAHAELGFLFGDVKEFELGVRETFLYDSDFPMSYLGGFATFYYLAMEMGWAYSPNAVSQFYFGFYIQIHL